MTVLNPVPKVNITVQTVQARPARDVAKRAALFACASDGPTLTPQTYAQPGASRAAFGEGLLARGHAIHAANDPKSTPVTLVRLPSTTPGVLHADLSEYTGTAEISAAVSPTPLGWYQPRFEVLVGGVVGTDTNIEIRRSADGGRTFTDIKLGDATSLILPGLGVQFDLGVSDAEYIALANDIRTKALAHFIYTTAAVHGGADTTSDDSVAAAATTTAQATTLIGTLLTAIGAHVILTSGSVHGSADTIAQTELAAMAIPTNEFDGVIVANALKEILNDHEGRVASVHGSADATNVVTANDALEAELNAGDIIAGYTDPPRWTVASIFDSGTTPPTGAIVQLRQNAPRMAMIAIAEEVIPSDAPTLSAALNYLEAAGIDAMFVFPSRRQYTSVTVEEVSSTFADADPDTLTRATGSWIADGVKVGMRATVTGSSNNDGVYLPIVTVTATVLTFGGAVAFAGEGPVDVSILFEETEEDWISNVASEWSSVEDMRLARVDGQGRGASPGSPTIDTDRPWAVEMMSTLIIDPIDVEPGQVKPLGGNVGGRVAPTLRFRIYENTTKIHYDADQNPGIPVARGNALRRHQDDQQPYINRGLTLAGPNDALDTIVKLRLANEWKRIVRLALTQELLLGQFADTQDPNRLSQGAVNSINANVTKVLRPAFTGKVSNLDSLPPNAFFAVDPESDLSTGFIDCTGKIITKFYPEGFNVALSVVQPGQV
jgi:hypothetical protein